MIALEAPDGSLLKAGIYGRGANGLTHAQVSRHQFSIQRSASETFLVKNLGSNRKP